MSNKFLITGADGYIEIFNKFSKKINVYGCDKRSNGIKLLN